MSWTVCTEARRDDEHEVSTPIKPDWIDPAAWDLALAYTDRIWAGDEDALDEAIDLAVQVRDIRKLPEATK